MARIEIMKNLEGRTEYISLITYVTCGEGEDTRLPHKSFLYLPYPYSTRWSPLFQFIILHIMRFRRATIIIPLSKLAFSQLISQANKVPVAPKCGPGSPEPACCPPDDVFPRACVPCKSFDSTCNHNQDHNI